MAAKMRGSVINLVVLIILAGFLITIFQAASVESHEDKVAENSKAAEEKAVEATKTSEKPVEGAGIADKVKRWASLASDKLPKSFSFKRTAAPASENSPGAAETVKGTISKGYASGKKATQDVIDSIGQTAQKTGEKIKPTAGKANGEL
uniref:Uncharacterized protein n=1 Tax=Picea sitchensis TaxID=3332 RepID=B8LM34_PICSI|nr:unknown [Picea sitchensis]